MNAASKTVLIVDDEAPILRFLRASLAEDGFKVVEARTGRAAIEAAAAQKPDLILLDLGLPDADGLDVLRRLREWTSAPVIVISARGDEKQKVSGLDSGADDYLTKPFGVAELRARIRVALRHAARGGGDPDPLYVHGELKVDLALRRVWLAKKEVRLSPNQYELLALLVKNAGRVVPQEKVLRDVWGGEASPESVRLLIHELRHRIEKDPVRPKHLKTEPGVGYRLESVE